LRQLGRQRDLHESLGLSVPFPLLPRRPRSTADFTREQSQFAGARAAVATNADILWRSRRLLFLALTVAWWLPVATISAISRAGAAASEECLATTTEPQPDETTFN
jgi:hypothetical protein